MKEKFYQAKRHFAATALLLFATSPLWAQQTESKGYPYQKYEVTFAVGMPIEDASNFFGYPSTSLPNETPLDKYHWGKYYLKGERTSPIFSMGLHYHFSKHWAVGLQASYHHMWRQCFETTTGKHAYSFNLHHTALMASMRYYYAIRAKHCFYSGLSLGVGQLLYKSYTDHNFTSSYNIAADFTLFGFMIGTKLYGFGELGSYQMGSLRAGMGYRF